MLAVGAHPDDVEGQCGGTLALLAARDVPVHVACVTAGERGVRDQPPAETREMRLLEAARAAELCGAASFTPLGGDDLGLNREATWSCGLALISLVRSLRANLLITHAPSDYHPDHRATSDLVLAARIAAGVPGLADEPPLECEPDVVFMDAALGLGFEPHVWIDVTDGIETRRAMLAAHASQRTLLFGQNLVDTVETLSRLRGAQRGCEHAEAFRGCETWPRPDGGIRRLVLLLESVDRRD